MNIDEDSELVRLRSTILEGMRHFVAETEVAYTEEHIRICERTLNEHLEALSHTQRAPDALDIVRRTVEALNDLNASCDGELIETGQREDICALLIRAGSLLGFNGHDEDVTEAWREW